MLATESVAFVYTLAWSRKNPAQSFLMHTGNPAAGWERTEKKLCMLNILVNQRGSRTGD